MNLIEKLKADYKSQLFYYQKMLDYYSGNHDILKTYKFSENRANHKIIRNFIMTFVESEISFTFGKDISYVSKSGDTDIINAIDYNLYHWQSAHNQELCRQLEIYGTAYELYYTNAKGEFCGRILNPTNSIVYTDADNIPQIFIHFYKKKYDDAEYYDVYYPNKIEIYKNDVLQSTKSHIFGGVPVSVCSIGTEQTIYNKIKTLNDAWSILASNAINTDCDNRNAYLVTRGMKIDDEIADMLRKQGILSLSAKDAQVEWLIKDVSPEYLQAILDELTESMYAVCQHINQNDRLSSNVSGVALRSQLTPLEMRCSQIFSTVADTIYDRLDFLFRYLELKNQKYDWKDVIISYNANIPTDLEMMSRVITNVGDKISLESAIKLLGISENPANEIAKIKQEREDMGIMDLENITHI